MQASRPYMQEQDANVTEDLYGEPEVDVKRTTAKEPEGLLDERPNESRLGPTEKEAPLAHDPAETRNAQDNAPVPDAAEQPIVSEARESLESLPPPTTNGPRVESEPAPPQTLAEEKVNVPAPSKEAPEERSVAAQPDPDPQTDVPRENAPELPCESPPTHPEDPAASTTTEDHEAERMQRVVHALTQQLVLRYPWSDAHTHTILEENHRITASLRVPAMLGLQKPAQVQRPVEKGAVDECLYRQIREQKEAQRIKLVQLRNEYRAKHQAWSKYCASLDRERERRASATSTTPQDETPGKAWWPTTRSFRRGGLGSSGFGDAVRSEAEFQEILASLENAEMQDPVVRAARTSATVPDMCLDPQPQLDVDNGYVADSTRFYFGGFDPDVWSEEERNIFARRYVLYPKQFGRIAEKLPHKTPNQCVAFYYLHKHLAGYKALLNARHRERRKKTKSKPKKSKGSALITDIAATEAEQKEGEADEERSGKRPSDEPPPRAKKSRTKQRESSPPAETELERDLAAAEALEALATLAAPAPEPKKRRAVGTDEPKSRSRGPHWSMSERAEFLRLLAIYGKDWNALAAAFPAKTPAQTRNFFARHASESTYFQEAAALAQRHAAESWEEKSHAALAFVQAWYDALPEGASKASITSWPSPSMPPPPAPRELVVKDEPAPAPVPPPPPPAHAQAPDDDETDDEEQSSTRVPMRMPDTHVARMSYTPPPPPPTPRTSVVPVPPAPPSMSYAAYGPPRPVHHPMHASPALNMYYRDAASSPTPGAMPRAMPPPGMYGYPMPKYPPAPTPPSPYMPASVPRMPMRPGPNMGYFHHTRQDRWPT